MMGKIKLNLDSGVVVEKPLINAFRANNFEYVILDNEMNGSMGLPIILVCKLENGKLIKIEDQNEWQIVKEYLKNIIAGSQVELVKVPNILPANDVYYTQLTLPVPSFDALKKAYTLAGSDTDNNEGGSTDINVNAKPINNTATSERVTTESSVQPVIPTPETPTVDPVTPVSETPTVSVNPTSEPVAPTSQVEVAPVVNEIPSVNTEQPVVAEPVPENAAPTIDLNIPNAPVMDNPSPINPVSQVPPVSPAPDTTIDLNAPIPSFGDINTPETPTIDDTPIAPVLESAPQVNVTPDIPVTPAVEQSVVEENTPVVSIAPSTENESPFKEQKEAFMQACENMFDALVQKFEKELENKQ